MFKKILLSLTILSVMMLASCADVPETPGVAIGITGDADLIGQADNITILIYDTTTGDVVQTLEFTSPEALGKFLIAPGTLPLGSYGVIATANALGGIGILAGITNVNNQPLEVAEVPRNSPTLLTSGFFTLLASDNTGIYKIVNLIFNSLVVDVTFNFTNIPAQANTFAIRVSYNDAGRNYTIQNGYELGSDSENAFTDNLTAGTSSASLRSYLRPYLPSVPANEMPLNIDIVDPATGMSLSSYSTLVTPITLGAPIRIGIDFNAINNVTPLP